MPDYFGSFSHGRNVAGEEISQLRLRIEALEAENRRLKEALKKCRAKGKANKAGG